MNKNFSKEDIEDFFKLTSKENKDSPPPLKKPSSFSSVSKISFSPLEGNDLKEKKILSKDISKWSNLPVTLKVLYAKKKMKFKEIASIEENSLVSFDDFCDEPVKIYLNDVFIGKGEIVSVDGKFAIRILSLKRN